MKDKYLRCLLFDTFFEIEDYVNENDVDVVSITYIFSDTGKSYHALWYWHYSKEGK